MRWLPVLLLTAAMSACSPPPPSQSVVAGAVAGSGCGSDADCRAVSDYCSGCDCRALAAAEPAPACSGPGVRCLIDPCMHSKAVCEAGKCAIRSKWQ